MLLNGTELIHASVMGLQTGDELAHTADAIINPHHLSVIAYEVDGSSLSQDETFLQVNDIRELAPPEAGVFRMIIDSNDEFVEIDDIVRLKSIYKLRYRLIGKPVYTTEREKVGKVSEYIIDSSSFVIQQLVVKKPMIKSFNDSELLVHRAQIAEVTDDAVIIKTARIPKQIAIRSDVTSYVNPFRQAGPKQATESSDTAQPS